MAKFFTAVALLLAAIALDSSSNAFVPTNHRVVKKFGLNGGVSLNALPTPEESAKALGDYMAKAHEEKLKAVEAAASTRDAEIKALKEELASLKTTRGNSIELASSATPESNEELAAKLAAYQKFMAEYIVKSAEEKSKAVKAAEAAVAQKYEAKLALPSAASTVPTTSTSYDKRNAKVSAAAAAGKSRWGDSEVFKAIALSKDKTSVTLPPPPEHSVTAEATAALPATILTAEVPTEVVEADHGLRADGGVGGLTLAERVMQGSKADAASAAVAIVDVTNLLLFDKRNERIVAAAKAGLNTRWGEMEIEKAEENMEYRVLHPVSAKTAIKSMVEVEEADHGLRADGSVGGPSLLERVNLGASMLQP